MKAYCVCRFDVMLMVPRAQTVHLLLLVAARIVSIVYADVGLMANRAMFFTVAHIAVVGCV